MPNDTSQPAVRAVMDLVRLGERATAVLADLDQTRDATHSHYRDCWQHHAGCLAARIRRTLTGEDHPQ